MTSVSWVVDLMGGSTPTYLLKQTKELFPHTEQSVLQPKKYFPRSFILLSYNSFSREELRLPVLNLPSPLSPTSNVFYTDMNTVH